MSNKRTKRQKTGQNRAFGAPSELDTPSNVQQDPSSSASSTRNLSHGNTLPALTTICARVFASNFARLRQNKDVWDRISQSLLALPDFLIPKIFAMLRQTYSTYLTHEVIVTYFLRGPSVTLQMDLPGVKKRTILDIARFNPDVQELELTSFHNIPDSTFAALLEKLPSLHSIVLRGCTKVGAESMQALARVAPDVRILNLNYTSVTPASLAMVVKACPHLEVIKLAGVQNWTDATLTRAFADLPDGYQLPALHTLKLRQTSITDASLDPILNLCPSLRKLDISFTLVRHPSFPSSGTSVQSLEKLSMTSTAVSPIDLVNVISLLPGLRTLAIGAMGASRGSRATIDNTSAMTMTDDALLSLTMILEQFQNLESISLVGNTKLGLASKHHNAVSTFISKVGRRCKKLNLAGIHTIRSFDLAGLMSTSTEVVSPLETLNLNNTSIDDEAALYIAACPSLKTLAVAGTKMTEGGIFSIIDSCEELESIDLTSCRAIRVVDRRRIFEVWFKVCFGL